MDHLTISGPTLAAWLSVLTKCNRPCDGLLFGSICSTTTTQAHDTSDALVVEEHEGRVASTYACISNHSFYSNTGQIEGTQLQELVESICSHSTGDHGSTQQQQQQQLLGWFSYRPGTPCMPSMREAAVTQSLQHWLQSSSSSPCPAPAVFGLVTSQPDHNQATISLQYTFYTAKDSRHSGSQTSNPNIHGNIHSSNRSSSKVRQQTEHPTLQSLELRVQNLGAIHGGSAGNSTTSSSSWWGAAAMPALAAALRLSGVLSEKQQAHSLSNAASLSSGVVSAVDGVYASLLDELQTHAAKVAEHQKRVDELRAANALLRREVLTHREGLNAPATQVIAAGAGGSMEGLCDLRYT